VCDDGTAIPRVMTSAPRHVVGVTNIMNEIYNYGPVVGAFNLPTDWEKQIVNDSIYVYSGAPSEGGHAMVVIGWGVRTWGP